jgi:tRNA dimethylallyltransferase
VTKALLLLGPTASGKTAVALHLGRRFEVEIVSVDSAQVYRDMDVGTAKPSPEARAAVPHHLIDIVDPTEAYSAGRFRADALRLMAEIASRGCVPLLAGGTMLYFRTLTRGLADLPAADPAIRAEIEARAARASWPILHAELAKVDSATAARLEPNDAHRIQRALEVHRITGRSLSELQAMRKSEPPPFDALSLVLEPSDRAVLHRRIDERFAAMLGEGLVEEVKELRKRYRLDGGLPAMRAVGYRQVWETLEGEKPADTLAARGAAATRQLAKRQLTWLRSMDEVERLDCLRPDLADAVEARVARFLSRRRGT